jgi:hypothetical protein
MDNSNCEVTGESVQNRTRTQHNECNQSCKLPIASYTLEIHDDDPGLTETFQI